MRRLTEIMDFTIDDLCKNVSISQNNSQLNDIVNKFIEATQTRKMENYAQWNEIKTEAKDNDLLRYMIYRSKEINPQMIDDLLSTESNPDIAIAVFARDDLSTKTYQKAIKIVSEEMIIEKFKEINLNYDADRSFYLAFPVQTYGHIPTYESYYFSQTTIKYMIEEMIKNNKPMYEGFPLKYIYSEEKLEDIFNKLSNEEQITTNIAENPHLPMELRERAYALGFNHNESSINTPPFVCEELYKSCIDIYTEEDYSTSTKEMLNLVSENGKQLIKILKTGNLPESCQLDLYKRLKTIFHDSQNVFNKLVLTATSKQLLNEIATFE